MKVIIIDIPVNVESCDAETCNAATKIEMMYPVNTLSHRTACSLLSSLYSEHIGIQSIKIKRGSSRLHTREYIPVLWLESSRCFLKLRLNAYHRRFPSHWPCWKVAHEMFQFSLSSCDKKQLLHRSFLSGHFTLNDSQAHILRCRPKKPLNPSFLAPHHKMWTWVFLRVKCPQ